MHKEFLREIVEKACNDEAEARALFHKVMENLPDDVIADALPSASELLSDIQEKMKSDPECVPMIKGYTCMFNELTNELQKRMMNKIRK